MERLSVSLDEKSISIIKKFLEKYETSHADVIRRALNCLDSMEGIKEKAPVKDILIYIDFLANKEHLIVDIAHWKLIFTQIGEGTDIFWEEVYDIGDAHRKEYFDKGLREVKQILKYLEKTNWFKLSIDSDKSFTLILAVLESSKFIKTFLEGLFSKHPQKVKISQEYMKIRINIC